MLRRYLAESPVVPAVRQDDDLDEALASPAGVIFLLTGSLRTIRSLVGRVQQAGKRVVVHVDLIAGLAADAVAVQYLVEQVAPDGIISTRNQLIQAARKTEAVWTLQRLFVLDSQALESGVASVGRNQPDAVEVLPGVAPKAIQLVHQRLPGLTIIAGGLIRTKSDIQAALAAGAISVSVSHKGLWRLSREDVR